MDQLLVAHPQQVEISAFTQPLLQRLYDQFGSANEKEVEASTLFYRKQKVALVQRAPDGTLLFSDAQDHEAIETSGYSKIKIVGKPSVAPSKVPRLGQAAQVLNIMPSKRPKTGVALNPAQCLEYGLFSSFAPCTDSSRASFSSAETSLVLNKAQVTILPFDASFYPPEKASQVFDGTPNPSHPTLAVTDDFSQQKAIDESLAGPVEPSTLKQVVNLEWEKILKLSEHVKQIMSAPSVLVQEWLLKENNQLLFLLNRFQSSRFKQGKHVLSAVEKETGKMNSSSQGIGNEFDEIVGMDE